jgi:proteasome accessory factor A
LKLGSTALILDLLEEDRLPKFALADPVGALRTLSHHPEGPWLMETTTGQTLSALDLLGEYLSATRSLPPSNDGAWVRDAWAETLQGLGGDRTTLIGKIDWITKEHLLKTYQAAEDIPWNHPALESLDLEYHKTNPADQLAHGLLVPFVDLGLPDHRPSHDYQTCPPLNTRAAVRSALMQRHAQEKFYAIDWDYVQAGPTHHYSLDDPFDLVVPPPPGPEPL